MALIPGALGYVAYKTDVSDLGFDWDPVDDRSVANGYV